VLFLSLRRKIGRPLEAMTRLRKNRRRGIALNELAPLSTGGFSLIEALVALTITSMAGAVLLLGVQSSLDTTIEAVDRTIADGIAQQTIDEIMTKRYTAAGGNPLGTVLGPTVSELLGNGGAALFAETDAYAGYVAQPIKGAWGETLGTGDDNGNLRLTNFRVRSDYFQSWRVRVDVYYVNPTNNLQTSITPTYARAIEVNVELVRPNGAIFPLANRKRVITYIPPPST
jgi:type II secretory pathway pseudopilin PulG